MLEILVQVLGDWEISLKVLYYSVRFRDNHSFSQ